MTGRLQPTEEDSWLETRGAIFDWWLKSRPFFFFFFLGWWWCCWWRQSTCYGRVWMKGSFIFMSFRMVVISDRLENHIMCDPL